MPPDTQLLYALNSLAGRSPLLDGGIVFFASYVPYVVVILFLMWAFFRSRRGERGEMLLVAGLAAFVARFGVTELIRLFYQRPRPFLDLPVHQLLTSREWSFPSGHATFFFALATAVYLYDKKWGAGFFIAALLIAISRVAAGVHYPSDIVAGFLIGAAVAYAAFYLVRKISAPPAPKTTIATY